MRYLYTILFFLIGQTATHAVTANFTVDFNAGCTPLVVHFTNTSTGATSYSWDLGNGTLTPSTNPSTSYIPVGTYTVTLTAYNGASSSVKTMVITVYPLPTVNFIASDTTVCPGTPVTFTSTTSGGVPGPLSYIWNFGDGATSTLGGPSHAYSTSGFYNVTLLATNAQGCQRSRTKVSYIEVYPRPMPFFTGSPVNICTPPGTVTFTNTSSGALPLSYVWNFGTGPTSTLATPTATYSIPGTYNVKLVVTDGYGCKDSLTRPAYIYVGSMSTGFICPATACMRTPVSFPNTSGPHTSRTWNYGDGSFTDTTYNGNHTYLAAGTYTVTLTIVNGPCTSLVTHVLTIHPAAVADFTISPAFPCPAPATITYSSTVPAGSTVGWLYEGGATGSGPTGAHTYTTNGIKTTRMIVTSPAGCIDTFVKKDTIYNIDFNATASPLEGCVPLTVNFNTSFFSRWPDTLVGANPYPYPVSSYSWNFGDGSSLGSGTAPTHTYTAVGIYIATVTATTSNGCTVSDTLMIRVGAPPVITFSISPTHVCYGDPVTFTATVISGPVTRYEWLLGAGFAATSAPVLVYTYPIPGYFTATVTPYFNGCPGAPVTLSTIITVDSPRALIGYTRVCHMPTTIQFEDESLGDDSHLWMFGDGGTSTLDDPIHTYSAIGTYTVTLATYNATSGCRDTAYSIISMVTTPMNFYAHDTAVCVGDTVFFNGVFPGGRPDTIRWYVNGIHKPYWTDTAMIDTFTVGGLYSVTLAAFTAQGCWDTVIKNNYVIVGDPRPGFRITPPSGCWPLTAVFTDTSTDVPGATLSSFIWDFGDGSTASLGVPTTTHVYTAAGTYLVRSWIADIIGCVDSAGPVTVTVHRPTADFAASNVHPCINDPVNFSNASLGYVSCFWTFGDGGSSTGTTPTHVYSTTGSFTVRLVVTDINGCTDTMIQLAYINVTKPSASFTMSDTFSICAPVLVSFTNTSTGGSINDWKFGDGNISSMVSPTNMYLTPGLYPVRLIVSDSWGCTDTAAGHLNLYGYSGSLTYTPLFGCAPLLVSFNAAITNVPNIIWDFGDGSTVAYSGVDTATHLYTVPGAYVPKLILSDNTGCQNSSVGPFTIKVDEMKAKFGVFPSSCIGLPFFLVDSSEYMWMPPNAWFWNFAGDTSSLASPVYPAVNTPGNYPVTLKVSNSWGCVVTLTADITIHPPPTITTLPDTIVCVTDAASLTAFGAVTYAWSGPVGTLSCPTCNPSPATPVVPSTYTVVGTDANGCKDTALVNVGLRTHTTAVSGGDTSFCSGGSVPIFDSGAHKYLWIPAGGLSSATVANPIASPASSITYTVMAQLGSCVPDTDYVHVKVFATPTVDAGKDQEVLAGTKVELSATGKNIATYLWSPSAGMSCKDCQETEVTALESTTYVVDVLSSHGCHASDSVNIYLFCDGRQVFLPNVFTPNNDGKNDVFYPRGTGINLIKSFRIYNRWGELLFERSNFQVNDESYAWDGIYQGETLRPDVYVYVVDAVCTTGKPVLVKGDITLIR
ncbi:MAG: PKD domain-containing protein [Chitinophagaceae bacterium]|nr:PKD domain-containing protein [Chitinophagaceae bacterium]